MSYTRNQHTASLLTNTQVLVTGGYQSGGNISDSAELYDLSTETWTVTSRMNSPRERHTETLLNNGKILVTGGFDHGVALNSAELYNP